MRAIRLSLPLLVLGVAADHADDALPPHDLALVTNLPNRRPYLHTSFLQASARSPPSPSVSRGELATTRSRPALARNCARPPALYSTRRNPVLPDLHLVRAAPSASRRFPLPCPRSFPPLRTGAPSGNCAPPASAASSVRISPVARHHHRVSKCADSWPSRRRPAVRQHFHVGLPALPSARWRTPCLPQPRPCPPVRSWQSAALRATTSDAVPTNSRTTRKPRRLDVLLDRRADPIPARPASPHRYRGRAIPPSPVTARRSGAMAPRTVTAQCRSGTPSTAPMSIDVCVRAAASTGCRAPPAR